MDEHYRQWDALAPRGLALIGLGLSVTGHAIGLRSKGRGFLRWFLVGTLGLVIVNSGIALFGEAIKHRALYELKADEPPKA